MTAIDLARRVARGTQPRKQGLFRTMMPRDLFLAETQEPRRVVVEDVALLLFREERRLVDNGDGALDCSRPDHLIRSEHDAVREPRVNDRLQIAVKRPARLVVDDDPDIDVYLG